MKKFILVGIISFLFIPFSVGATNSGITAGPYVQRVTKKAGTIKVRTESAQKLTLYYQKEGAKKWKTKKDSSSKTKHRYRLTSLKTNTNYTYYLTNSSGTKLTQKYTFTTRANITDANPLRVAVVGDSRPGDAYRNLVAEQMMFWSPDIILHSGDFNDTGTEEEFIDDVFASYQPLLAEKVMYGAIGNHEFTTEEAGPYKDFFEMPKKNSSSEDYYSFNYNKAHFATINTSLDYSVGSEQYNWLDEDLGDSKKEWKIVFIHYPPYSSGAHGSTEEMWDTIVPLFEEHDVDLVFSGHDHCYDRNQEINGVHYMVSAGGGATLYGQESDTTYSEKFVSDYHFVGMLVYPNKITIRGIDKSGYVFDRLTIR